MLLSRIHHKDTHATPPQTRWHVVLAILVAISMELIISDELTFGMKYAAATMELLLILFLIILPLRAAAKRLFAILLIALISFINFVSLIVVIYALFGGLIIDGHPLLMSSIAIFLTNIIVFGLWYWELDNTRLSEPDFLFPQKSNNNANNNWQPSLFDYLYLSLTNATAFSPTDTPPLTDRAKLLMAIQSIISLVTIALVVARAVNILS